jgi:hypothetical protein
LILTNHHCVESCLAELSSKEVSLIDAGYVAPAGTAERRCSTQVADVLVGLENVTASLTRAVVGLDDKAANVARKKTLTELEQNCEQASARARSGRLKCQAVTLYEGGEYFLYKYKRYDDVRLVFAPEADIAAFGGDPDNFQFPRWSLDFSARGPGSWSSCRVIPAAHIVCKPARSWNSSATSRCRATCCAHRSCAAA